MFTHTRTDLMDKINLAKAERCWGQSASKRNGCNYITMYFGRGEEKDDIRIRERK